MSKLQGIRQQPPAPELMVLDKEELAYRVMELAFLRDEYVNYGDKLAERLHERIQELEAQVKALKAKDRAQAGQGDTLGSNFLREFQDFQDIVNYMTNYSHHVIERGTAGSLAAIHLMRIFAMAIEIQYSGLSVDSKETALIVTANALKEFLAEDASTGQGDRE